MSVMASIDIYFYKNHWHELSANELFCHLQTHGWTTDMDKKQEYLPINDNDMFDWQCQKLDNDELYHIIKQKSLNFEIIGIGMTWQNSNIGGHFLLEDNCLTFMIDYNRQMTDYGLTDFDWYLSKLIPIFKDSKFYIEAVKCEHVF